jgi:organic radical activating enzyme
LKAAGLEIFLETSGTHPFSGEFDWVCLSPKRQQPPLAEAFGRAHELKVIIQSEDDFQWAEENARRVGRYCRLYMQPEWSVYDEIIPKMVEYAKANPKWSISVQTHKFMRIP